ncbi:hypothetical protein BpHYR1_005002 [Brachionus plicatilis]|uniref:Uncharacterized protein n=1 Tax=Brachionus plicatilis TaxID=10195 RepID=A0A3M7QKP6_BRAPC|nr:hypothetical protein BpHYR1_005002 [Brachionus plicatilis]
MLISLEDKAGLVNFMIYRSQILLAKFIFCLLKDNFRVGGKNDEIDESVFNKGKDMVQMPKKKTNLERDQINFAIFVEK